MCGRNIYYQRPQLIRQLTCINNDTLMSRIDYISIEGLRIDGRRKDEPRNTKLFFGSETSVDYLNYDGVSEILQGLNKVQVLIKGPSELEVKGAKNVYGILEEKVDIHCEILLSTEKKVKNSPNERLIKDLAMAVKSTYQEMIISHCYKTSSISIFINVIEYDGSIKSTVLNAVGLALIDAGVSLKDIVSSSTVSYLDSTVLTGIHLFYYSLLDPNQMEINASTATLYNLYGLQVKSSTGRFQVNVRLLRFWLQDIHRIR
eukprot:XP_765925.1 exosome complex exonuclease Rrp41 [Theileria parva strain Muguga]